LIVQTCIAIADVGEMLIIWSMYRYYKTTYMLLVEKAKKENKMEHCHNRKTFQIIIMEKSLRILECNGFTYLQLNRGFKNL